MKTNHPLNFLLNFLNAVQIRRGAVAVVVGDRPILFEDSSIGAVFGAYVAEKARRMAICGELCWEERYDGCDNERPLGCARVRKQDRL